MTNRRVEDPVRRQSDGTIEAWLIEYLAARTGLDPSELDSRKPFAAYGLASIEGIALVQKLGGWLGRPLSPTLAWDYPTPASLAEHLGGNPSVALALDASRPPDSASQAVAIVGMACRLPGARDLNGFWQLLREGRDAITEVPPDRWPVDAYYDADPAAPGRMVSRWGGFLEDLDRFDAEFFGITPREAAQLDPRQRLLLEVAWEALEDGGIPPDSLAGSRTGVFVANLVGNYGSLIFDSFLDVVDGYSGTGNGDSVLANRLSYVLDLRGPSLAVDTACSGSLVAVHLACQSLERGESTLALAGGVNVILKPHESVFFSKTGALSPDGRCMVFDERANGIVRSEGAGLVVLKRLSQALLDRDRVYAVIRGSAINQDGRSNGLMAPNRLAQEAMLRDSYARAGISPAKVQYVEAHGTGTELGDPIEVGALGTVLRSERTGVTCALGSVKTNIGHTEAAAGVAALIKVALSIKHRLIPPNLHFATPNPLIPFGELGFSVQRTLGPWPDDERPLIAGVSAFGFAGTNAHLVVSEPPPESGGDESGSSSSGPYLLPVSARSPRALDALVADYHRRVADIDDPSWLRDVCCAASLSRSHLEERLAVVASSPEELLDRLESAARGQPSPGVARGVRRRDREPRLVFVFSGQGSHWAGMGRELLGREPLFRTVLEQCDSLIRRHGGWSVLDVIHEAEQAELDRTDVAQPAIFSVQVALAAVWLSWGITPAAIVGQSLGEIAAAHVAGVLSLEDAVRVAVHRSRLMARTSGKGKTAAVGLPLEETQELVARFGGSISIAGNTSLGTTVVSGEPAAVESLLEQVQRRDVFARPLAGVDVAFHSYQMDPLMDELVESLQGIEPRPAGVALYSTVTGAPVAGPELGPAYWSRNLREPFQFAGVLGSLVEAGHDTFLEISPHPVLTVPIEETARAAGGECQSLSSLRRSTPELASMFATLGSLYAAGYDVAWSRLHPDRGRKVDLPHYPWQRERHWFDQLTDGVTPSGFRPALNGARLAPGRGAHPLLGEHVEVASAPGQHVWTTEIGARSPRYLGDHRIRGTAVLPGAAYVEQAVASARGALGAGPVRIENIVFVQPLLLANDERQQVEVIVSTQGSETGDFQVFSRPVAEGPDSSAWTLHSTATVKRIGADELRAPEALEAILARCPDAVAGATHYQRMESRGFGYGPAFRTIETVWLGAGEVLAELALGTDVSGEAASYVLHPALLDGSLQAIASLGGSVESNGDEGLLIPVGSARVDVFVPAEARVTRAWCHARLRSGRTAAEPLEADVRLLDETGAVLADVTGFRLQQITGSALAALAGAAEGVPEWLYELRWIPKPRHRELAVAGASAPLSSAVDAARATVSGLCERHDLERYRHATADYDQLATAYAARALRMLGWQARAGASFATDELADALAIAAPRRRLFRRLLEMLAEDEALAQVGDDTWQVLRVPAEDALAGLDGLAAKYPADEPQLTLLRRCGEALAPALRGEVDPLQLLFGSPATIDAFYTDIPYFRVYNELVAEVVRRLADRVRPGRAIRILEIGAGTGATTAQVVEGLPAEHVEYVFTDVSATFLARAEQKFARYPFVRYRTLDVERRPKDQGFADGEFDIVIAANVLHATRDLRESLGNVRRLLAADGVLVLHETPGPQRWLDVTFGLTDGWWRFSDTDVRPGYPLVSPTAWRELFVDSGLGDTHVLMAGRDDSPQFVVVGGAGQVATTAAAGTWLVLDDDGGTGGALAAQLRDAGAECVVARRGAAFRRIAHDEFEVGAGEPEDFRRLLDEAPGLSGPSWRGAVHLWSLDAPPLEAAEAKDVAEAQRAGPLAIVHLLRALAQGEPGSAPAVWIVTRGAQPAGDEPGPLAVLQAPLWGLARVVGFEQPEIWGGIVDLDPSRPADELREVVTTLLSPDAERQVAYRNGERKALRLVRYQHSLPASTSRFRSDAAYLITGGLGGIGLEVAAWMVEKGARHLLLLGRSAVPPRLEWDRLPDDHAHAAQTRAVLALEARGAHVELASVDVGDAAAISSFLETYASTSAPPIRGVIHAAGLIKDELLARLDADAFEQTARPKISGSWLLHSLLPPDSLDFFVLFSSGSSITGMIGQANYAAANAFVDALAHHRRASGLPALAVNWGLWGEVGIIVRSDLTDQLRRGGLIPLAPAEGLRILDRLMASDAAQAAPMPIEWRTWELSHPELRTDPLYELLRDEQGAAAEKGAPKVHDRLASVLRTNDAAERRDIIEGHLRELAARVMRLSPTRLDVRQPLDALGLDSIMAVELRNGIETDLGLRISLVELLGGASLAQVAERSVSLLEQDQTLIEELVEQVERLSLDEVQSQLADAGSTPR